MNDKKEAVGLIANQIDSFFEKNGPNYLIGENRFQNLVDLEHKKGRQFVYCNSYAAIFEDYLIVFEKNEEKNIWLLDEISKNQMKNKNGDEVEIKKVKITGNQVQLV
jgi:predicted N-acyltransferase